MNNNNNSNSSNNTNSNKNAHHHHYGNEFSLFVGDLPYDCSDEKLQRLFQNKFKSVKRVQIIRNEDGSSRGFGFIRFEERGDFQAALAEGMKIDNNTLRLDTAHRSFKNSRSRYSSFNSTGSNSSNHHNHHQFNNNSNLHHQHHQHHHHNQAHSHQHSSQHHQPIQGNKLTMADPTAGKQPLQGNKLTMPDPTAGKQPLQQAPTQSRPNSSGSAGNSRINNPPHQKPLSQPQTSGTVDVAVPGAATNLTATTTAPTSLSSSDVVSHSTSALHSSQPNISAGQPTLGPDLRGYAHAAMMDGHHMMGASEQPSVMPPSSVYGHLYPYGPPPPFSYMPPPPPQPNPVIPISAVPPAPPNQATSGGIGQQHSLTGASGTRYNNTHHTLQGHASAPDANAMNSMSAASVQAPPPHQAPFYYYYPNPLYFDQTGAAAPPNLYHPQSFHPQFFALPNPAYIPNAHTYTNQHQTQPPLASQSDATTTLVNQQQPQPQSHQQQVNLRSRDIDAPIE